MLDELNLESKKRENNVRVLISQLEFQEIDWKEDNDLQYLQESEKNKEKLDLAINIALKHTVNVIVFPESSVPEAYIKKLQKVSEENGLIIIAGTQYYKSGDKIISKSPIIINGTIYYTEKTTPSPFEISPIEGSGLSAGERILIFRNTSIGDFCVLICADYLNEEIRNKVSNLNLDFLFVVAYQNDSVQYHSRINDNCEESPKGTYYIYSNILFKNHADGNSAIFGHVDRLFLEKIAKAGLTDRKPSKKIFGFHNSNAIDYLVCDFNIDNKKPSFARFVDTSPNVKIISYSKPLEKKDDFIKLIGHSDIRYELIDQLYVKPKEYSAIIKKIEERGIVFIIGDPGIGKTYTAVKILKEYYQNGYTPIWFTGLEVEERKNQRKVLEEFEIKPSSIIYFEDPFGRTLFEKRESLYTFLRPLTTKALKVKSKVIITSRRQIFEQFAEESLSAKDLHLFKEELNVVKPSYSKDDLLHIFNNYIQLMGVSKETESNKLIKKKIESKEINTPFEVREIIITAHYFDNISHLKKIIELSKEDSIKTFGYEIHYSNPKHQLIYIIILLFGQFKQHKLEEIFTIYSEQNSYPEELSKTSFKTLLRDLIGYRLEYFGRSSEFIRYSHPRYEEAIAFNILNFQDAEAIIANMFRALINSKQVNTLLNAATKFLFKNPNISLLIFKNIELDINQFRDKQMIAKAANKIIGSIKYHFDKKQQESSELYALLKGKFNINEFIKIANTTYDYSVLPSLLKYIVNYKYEIQTLFKEDEKTIQLDFERFLNILSNFENSILVTQCLELIAKLNKNFIEGFIKRHTHTSLLKLISNADIERRLELIDLLSNYNRIGDLVSFVNQIKNKVQPDSILRILLRQANPENRIFIDKGASIALTKTVRFSNLLPIGVKKVEGSFSEGDPIFLIDENGKEIGVGLTSYSSTDIPNISGQHSYNINSILGYYNGSSVVRRNNLIIFEKGKENWVNAYLK